MTRLGEGTDAPDLPETYGRFAIIGRGLDLILISRTLGLQPTNTSRAGSRSIDPLIPKFDVWALDTKTRESLDGTGAIREIVGVLQGTASNLALVMSLFPQASYQILLVSYVPPRRYPIVPEVTLDKQLLEQLAALKVRFDIDFTFLESDWV